MAFQEIMDLHTGVRQLSGLYPEDIVLLKDIVSKSESRLEHDAPVRHSHLPKQQGLLHLKRCKSYFPYFSPLPLQLH